jgi:phytoene dehydrogenase-like protein
MGGRSAGTGDGYDAIVVGSGMGGLTTAAYLATNGLRTLVLEQYDVAGGCSHVFRRKKMWEFDVGLHYVGDCEPDGLIPMMLRGVGVEDRVEWLEMDRDGFDTLCFPDLTFRVPRGWAHYRERLIEAFPHEREGIVKCTTILQNLGREAMQCMLTDPPNSIGGVMRMPLQARTAMRWGMLSLGAIFDHCKLSQPARGVLAGQAGLYNAPPSRAAALVHAILIDHYVRGGAHYPRGGGQVPAGLLVNVIQTHGGEVRTRARVDEILISGGRVQGVRLEDGETIGAPVVVSNADIKRTFFELVRPEHVSGRFLRGVRRYRMSPPIFTVYLGLDIDLSDRSPNTNWWWAGSMDNEDGYEPYTHRRVPREPWTYTVSGSLKDPDNREIAPEGHSSVEIMGIAPADYPYWNIDRGPAAGERYSKDPDYKAVKERHTDALIRTVAAHNAPFHDIEDHIVWREASTPITQERYTLTTEGAPYGIELSTDQFGLRRPRPKTRIPGLFLTGASTFHCHGIAGTMAGGTATASAVLGRNLMREVYDGEVFADRSRITAGGPDWDPFMQCRRLSKKKPPRGRREADQRSGAPVPL